MVGEAFARSSIMIAVAIDGARRYSFAEGAHIDRHLLSYSKQDAEQARLLAAFLEAEKRAGD